MKNLIVMKKKKMTKNKEKKIHTHLTFIPKLVLKFFHNVQVIAVNRNMIYYEIVCNTSKKVNLGWV